jgi:hypothetical protein
MNPIPTKKLTLIYDQYPEYFLKELRSITGSKIGALEPPPSDEDLAKPFNGSIKNNHFVITKTHNRESSSVLILTGYFFESTNGTRIEILAKPKIGVVIFLAGLVGLGLIITITILSDMIEKGRGDSSVLIPIFISFFGYFIIRIIFFKELHKFLSEFTSLIKTKIKE